MLVADVLKLTPLEIFLHWIRVRHTIYLKKQRGEPPRGPRKRAVRLLEAKLFDGAVKLGLDFTGTTELQGELVVEGNEEDFQLGHAIRERLNRNRAIAHRWQDLSRGARTSARCGFCAARHTTQRYSEENLAAVRYCTGASCLTTQKVLNCFLPLSPACYGGVQLGNAVFGIRDGRREFGAAGISRP